ncbi:hypothetical protein EIP91_005589 [Steccherinum ochraceum]|uniref:Uncharacterized protein n=1 Tax=Steccherinum ochraceum TaxID=92696 RepID=A0A4V2MVT4_9APHY|nr:hypothetical protein EIP91_005589 [Steccherinum ochraceum]
MKIVARFPGLRYLEISNAWDGPMNNFALSNPNNIKLPYLEDLVLLDNNHGNCEWDCLLDRLELPETTRILFSGNAEFADIDDVVLAFGSKMDEIGAPRKQGSLAGPFSALWSYTSTESTSHKLWTDQALRDRETSIPPLLTFHAKPGKDSMVSSIEDIFYPRATDVEVFLYSRTDGTEHEFWEAVDVFHHVETACIRTADYLPGWLEALDEDDDVVEDNFFRIFESLKTLLIFGCGDPFKEPAEYWGDMVKMIIRRKHYGQPISKLVLVPRAPAVDRSTRNAARRTMFDFRSEVLASLREVVDVVVECRDAGSVLATMSQHCPRTFAEQLAEELWK